jgi:hypothetical protein
VRGNEEKRERWSFGLSKRSLRRDNVIGVLENLDTPDLSIDASK